MILLIHVAQIRIFVVNSTLKNLTETGKKRERVKGF
jgi:hypothetical protein